MVQYIPRPDPQTVLPPLLACLPTAFASPHPPPALLPLLSPILRQRLKLLATNTASSSTESWLPLLCWEPDLAKSLVELVTESDAYELHPISGEIEFGSVEPLKYRRLDEETLQSRIDAPEMGLTVVVLWCEDDIEGGGDGGSNGWRIAEVKPLDNQLNQWSLSMREAEEQAHQRAFEEVVRETDEPTVKTHDEISGESENDNDDDYWAQYDNTPARTPGTGRSPGQAPCTQQSKHPRTTSEAEYFARYAKVQPEMDNDDPSSTDREAVGASTLNGNTLTSRPGTMPRPELGDVLSNVSSPLQQHIDANMNHPKASSPSSGPATVSHLEDLAESQSPSDMAVKQHVSTSMKSLFRLCRGVGMDKTEFEDLVRTELDTLSMMEYGD